MLFQYFAKEQHTLFVVDDHNANNKKH